MAPNGYPCNDIYLDSALDVCGIKIGPGKTKYVNFERLPVLMPILSKFQRSSVKSTAVGKSRLITPC
jgi:hypothetical protein